MFQPRSECLAPCWGSLGHHLPSRGTGCFNPRVMQLRQGLGRLCPTPRALSTHPTPTWGSVHPTPGAPSTPHPGLSPPPAWGSVHPTPGTPSTPSRAGGSVHPTPGAPSVHPGGTADTSCHQGSVHPRGTADTSCHGAVLASAPSIPAAPLGLCRPHARTCLSPNAGSLLLPCCLSLLKVQLWRVVTCPGETRAKGTGVW